MQKYSTIKRYRDKIHEINLKLTLKLPRLVVLHGVVYETGSKRMRRGLASAGNLKELPIGSWEAWGVEFRPIRNSERAPRTRFPKI